MSDRLAGFQAWLTARAAEGDVVWVAGGILVFTAVAVVAFLVVRFVAGRVTSRFDSWRGTRIPAIRFQNQDILTADETTETIVGLVRLARVAVNLLLVYVYLNFVFRLFPATRGFSDELLGYLVAAVQAIAGGVVSYLPSLIFLVVLFLFGRWLIRIIGAVYSELRRNILECCHRAGIEIASPHLAAVRDGNQLQMPQDHLPKNYKPAAFRVWRLGGGKQE